MAYAAWRAKAPNKRKRRLRQEGKRREVFDERRQCEGIEMNVHTARWEPVSFGMDDLDDALDDIADEKMADHCGDGEEQKEIGDVEVGHLLLDRVTKQFEECCIQTNKLRGFVKRMNPHETAAERRERRAFSAGDLRVKRIFKTLDSFGWKRSPDQKTFHRNFMIACLPQIYREEWDQHKRRVLKEFDAENIDFEVLIMTPRRWGKTISVGMFVAAMLICVPDVEIGVFSTGSRASGSLMEMVIRFINAIDGANTRIVKANQEDLFLSIQSLGGLSSKSDLAVKLRTSPGTSKLHW